MSALRKRVLCLVLVLCLLTAVPVTRAEGLTLPDELFLTQEGSGTCTLCSAAMMVRSTLYIHGNDAWPTVTQEALRTGAWLNGVGLKWNFKYTAESCEVQVGYRGLDGISAEGLRKILEDHPEGIVFYCGDIPHAVFLFDEQDGVFYCAETVRGYSGERIPLEDSWIGDIYGTQERILANATAYWYVSSYTSKTVEGCTCREDLAGVYRVTTETADLLIRAGHGTGYSVMGYIPAGAEVIVTKASGTGDIDWAHVTYDGISGYASMRYLEKIAHEHRFEDVIHEPTCTEAGYTVHTCPDCGHSETDTPVEALGHDFGPWGQGAAAGTEQRECSRCHELETRYISRMGTVTGDYLRIRAGAGTDHEVLGFLMAGDRVEILEEATVNGMVWGCTEDGWISLDYVDLDEPEVIVPPATEPPATEPPATEPPATEPPATEPPATEPPATEPEKVMGTVTGNELRIRAGAGTGYEVLGFLMAGDRVEILEQKTVGAMTWGRTEDGWISLTYVKLDEPAEEPPATEPPATEPPATEPPATEPPATEPPATEPEPETRMGTVTGDYLRIRSGAGTDHEVLDFLMIGDRVEILEETTVNGMTWGRTKEGWISLDYVELDEPAEDEPAQTRIVTVDTDCLRIRSGAGLDHEIVGFLYRNAKVEILEETTVEGMTWGRTDMGWISMDYVK